MEGRDAECPVELGDRAREIITAPQPRAVFVSPGFGCRAVGGRDPPPTWVRQLSLRKFP